MQPVPSSPDILYGDARLVVLNKPAGLPAHAGPRGGPSVEDWFGQISRRKDGPWLAHRLDADTAGCLVVALRKATLIAVQAAFAAGLVKKTYWALCQGRPPSGGDEGSIDTPLRKVTSKAGWRMAAGPGGQAAVTDWRVVSFGGGLCWLELSPRTGRTHQVRAHCASLGCPILGDPTYGEGRGALRLLARSVALPLAPDVSAVAPPPPHMRGELASLGWDGGLSPSGTRS